MSTTTKKPAKRGGVNYKNVDRREAYQISLAHIDPPIFASGPTNAEWVARYGVDVKLGDVYYNSGSSYAPSVCTVADSTTPTWASVGAAATVTLQAAFANGKVITGATTAENAFCVGDATDYFKFYLNTVANDLIITSVHSSNITIAPAANLVLAPVSAATTLTGTLDVSSTFTVATNKLSVNATTGTLTSTGAFISTATTGDMIVINTDKFKVAAATGNVTIAGNCAVGGTITGTYSGIFAGTFNGTFTGIAWNANPVITLTATTGQGVNVNGQTVTSGDILYLSGDSSLTGAGGYWIRGYNTVTSSNAFSIASDGAFTIAGTAGSAALTISAGSIAVTGSAAITGRAESDVLMALTRSNSATGGNAITIAMGSSTVAGNAIGISYAGAGTGDAVSIVMTNANVAAGALVITSASAPTDAVIDLTVTGGNGGYAIDITSTAGHNGAHVINVTNGGAYSNNLINLGYASNNATGDAISITMTSAAVTAQALVVTGKAAATAPLVSLTGSGAAAGDVLYLYNTSGDATARTLNIFEHGTSTNEIVYISMDTAFAGDALSINMANAAVTANAVVVAGVAASTASLVSLTGSGASGGNILYISNTPSHAAANSIYITNAGTVAHNALAVVYSAASIGDAINVAMANAGAASQALVITSNVAHSGVLVSIGATGSLAGGTGKICSVTYDTGTLAVATSGYMLDLVDTTAATATSYAMHIACTSNEALYVQTGIAKFDEAIQTAGVTSTGAVTTTDAVSGGTVKVVGGRAYSAAASGTTHTNTTDETVLGTFTIKANSIKANTIVKVRYSVTTPSTNAADTYTVRLRLGPSTLTGTALITTAATDVVNNDVSVGDFQLVGRAAPGATAECVGCGMYSNFAATGAGAGGAMLTAYLAETNFATNGDLLCEVTGDWSAANAADQAHLDFLFVEII